VKTPARLVDTHIDQDAAAVRRIAEARRRNALIALQRLEEQRRPNLAGLNGRVGFDVGRAKVIVKANLQRNAGGRCCGDRPVGLRDRQRQRLLAEDRIAGPRRIADDLGVRAARRRDHHGVDIRARQEILVALVPALDAEPPRHSLGALAIHVGDAGELRARQLLGDHAGVPLPHAAGSDNTNAQRHVQSSWLTLDTCRISVRHGRSYQLSVVSTDN